MSPPLPLLAPQKQATYPYPIPSTLPSLQILVPLRQTPFTCGNNHRGLGSLHSGLEVAVVGCWYSGIGGISGGTIPLWLWLLLEWGEANER